MQSPKLGLHLGMAFESTEVGGYVFFGVFESVIAPPSCSMTQAKNKPHALLLRGLVADNTELGKGRRARSRVVRLRGVRQIRTGIGVCAG
jgi:hypothetical protein